MKNHFFTSLIFIFLIPICAHSQTDSIPRNGLVINYTQEELGGDGASLRYLRKLGDQGIMKFEFRLNLRGGYAGRVGYEILKLSIAKIELGIGVDVKYEHVSLGRFSFVDFDKLSLELPIELRLHLSPKYFIQFGISQERRLSSTESPQTRTRNENEWRLGLGFNF